MNLSYHEMIAEFPGVANKTMGHLVELEFQIKTKYFCYKCVP